MLDQRIESSVLGNDVEKSTWIYSRQLTNIEGDVEIQGVGTIPGYPHIVGTLAHRLHLDCQFRRQFGLRGTNEYPETDILTIKQIQIGRLDVLVIDQHVVDAPVLYRHQLRNSFNLHSLQFPCCPVSDLLPALPVCQTTPLN